MNELRWIFLYFYSTINSLQVVRTKDRCEVITKVFLALFVIILIIVYNEEFYKIVNQIHWQHVRISSTNSNQTTSNVKTQLTSSSIPEGYLVWSENCHMASVDPYLPDYLEAFDYFFDNEQNPVPNCTTPEPLVTKSYNKTLQSYVLHINYELKDIYLNGTDDDISCFSTNIFRDGDKGYG